MKIIDKTNRREIRSLTSSENANLLPVNRSSEAAQLLIQSIHSEHQWLECDCTDDKAVMFARKYDKHFSLVCHSKDGLHDKACPHFREIEGSSVFDKERTKQSMDRQALTYPDVSFCDKFATEKKITQNTKKTIGRRASGKRNVPKLTTLALFLIKQSQQHVICSNDLYYNQSTEYALQRFRLAAANTKFGPSTLNQWIGIGKESYKTILRRLYDIEKTDSWPKNKRPHAFICFVANTITVNDEESGIVSITVDENTDTEANAADTATNADKNKDKVNTKFYLKQLLLEHQGLRTDGPYLVFMMICRATKDRKYQSHTAYVKPIINDNWLMPVDSNYERKFAKRVVYHVQKGENWSIEKPLEGKSLDDCYLLPDFLIAHQEHHHLIEVMGMLNNQDYLDRKDYIVPRMKLAWPNHTVFELDPTSTDVTCYIKGLEGKVTKDP